MSGKRTLRTLVLEIPGQVVAWKRARVVKLRGGRTILTTATADRTYRAYVRRIAQELASEDPLLGPVACEIVASWGPGGRVVATFTELGNSGMWYPKTPDADNVAKGLLDAVKGVLLTDDAQVVDLRVMKVRTEEPS